MSKREDIIEATLDLIDEMGLQSVTYAQILKKAKVGSGTVFNYFGNKEELVNEVYREARIRMERKLLEGYDPGAGLFERFKCLQRNRLRFGSDYPREFRFIDSYSYSPYISAELRNMDDAASDAMVSIITEGQQQGILKEMNVKLCHQLVHGMIAYFIKGYFIDKFPMTEHEIQLTLEAAWKALRI